MRLLAIETSTNVTTSAVAEGERLLQRTFPERRQLAQRIAEWTAQTLVDAGWRPDEVELVAVGRGPGSWTGLRIGLGFARAFAWANGFECRGVPSAEATVAALLRVDELRAFYISPGRTGEVIVAEFARTDRLTKVAPEHPVPLDQFHEWLRTATSPTLVCGETLADSLPQSEWLRIVHQAATAEFSARWALANPDRCHDLAPIYATPSSAELKFGVVVTS